MQQFKKYSSINRDKHISGTKLSTFTEKIILAGYGNTMCIAQQKVHGSNFNISVSDEGIQVGRRGAFLEEGESLSGLRYVDLVKQNEDDYVDLYQQLKQVTPGLTQIIIYAELAGGKYGDDRTEDVQSVHNNADYYKDQFIYHYDIRLVINDEVGDFLLPTESTRYFQQLDLFHAKTLKTGTLNELMNFDMNTNHVSLELSGGQLREPEGIVIKSIDPDKQYYGENRIVIKKINSSFESKSQAKPKVTKAIEYSEKLIEYINLTTPMVNETRVESVYANLGHSSSDFDKSHWGLLTRAVLEDIHNELSKSHDIPLNKKDLGKVNKALSKHISVILKSW